MSKIEPKITVYMPTHNRLALFPRAVESVLSQSYRNIELIIVDDGSSDGSWPILEQYMANSTLIKCIRHNTPKGACAARNTAIKIATGEFITGIDDDDEFLTNHLDNLLNHWDDKYAGIVASLINDKGTQRVKQGKEYGCISLDSLLHYNRIGNQVFTLTSRMQAIQGFDENLPAFQDYDCWIRLSEEYGDFFKIKSHSYVLHTSHELGRISGNQRKRLEALNLFIDKHSGLLSQAHLNSLDLVKARIKGEKRPITIVLSYLCKQNWKLVAFALLDSFRYKLLSK